MGVKKHEDCQKIQDEQYKTPYHWDNNFRVERAVYIRTTRVLADLILNQISKKNDATLICDLGCGDGKSAYELFTLLNPELPLFSIVGADISAKAIAWAQKKVSHLKEIQFINGSIDELLQFCNDSYTNQFFILREVIEHLPEYEINRILSLLRAENRRAKLIITVPTMNTPVSEKHIRHYTKDSLTQYLTENDYQIDFLDGFGFRPKLFYRILKTLKKILNKTPIFWKIMNPAWRFISPQNAMTLICIASPKE